MAHRAATLLLSPPILPALPMVPLETQLSWFNMDVVFCNTNLLVSIGIGLVVVGGSREDDEIHTSSMAATRPHAWSSFR